MDDGPWVDIVFTLTRLRWLNRYWFGIWRVAFDDDKRMNDAVCLCIWTYGTILLHYASPFL